MTVTNLESFARNRGKPSTMDSLHQELYMTHMVIGQGLPCILNHVKPE